MRSPDRPISSEVDHMNDSFMQSLIVFSAEAEAHYSLDKLRQQTKQLLNGELFVSLPWHLNFGGNKHLTTLPDALHTTQSLRLWGCDGVSALPRRLHVGGDMDISHCNNLKTLPTIFHVDGVLYMQGTYLNYSIRNFKLLKHMRDQGLIKNIYGSVIPLDHLTDSHSQNDFWALASSSDFSAQCLAAATQSQT